MATAETLYTVRDASMDDALAIVELEKGIFPEGGTPGLWRMQAAIEHYAPGIKLAMLGDEIVGCVRGTMQPSHVNPERPDGSIVSLGVAEGHRRQGVGRLLLGEMVTEMQKDKPTGIDLYTRVSNLAMQGLAAEFNFAAEERVEDYYEQTAVPEDALYMVVRFGEAAD